MVRHFGNWDMWLGSLDNVGSRSYGNLIGNLPDPGVVHKTPSRWQLPDLLSDGGRGVGVEDSSRPATDGTCGPLIESPPQTPTDPPQEDPSPPKPEGEG